MNSSFNALANNKSTRFLHQIGNIDLTNKFTNLNPTTPFRIYCSVSQSFGNILHPSYVVDVIKVWRAYTPLCEHFEHSHAVCHITAITDQPSSKTPQNTQ